MKPALSADQTPLTGGDLRDAAEMGIADRQQVR